MGLIIEFVTILVRLVTVVQFGANVIHDIGYVISPAFDSAVFSLYVWMGTKGFPNDPDLARALIWVGCICVLIIFAHVAVFGIWTVAFGFDLVMRGVCKLRDVVVGRQKNGRVLEERSRKDCGDGA